MDGGGCGGDGGDAGHCADAGSVAYDEFGFPMRRQESVTYSADADEGMFGPICWGPGPGFPGFVTSQVIQWLFLGIIVGGIIAAVFAHG